MTGTSDILRLADDFDRAAGEVVDAAHEAFDQSGEKVARAWGDGVRAMAPNHLPHLPSAITHETRYSLGGVTVEIGPESGKRQGRLGRGEELGSRNQPPHLNGLRAMTAEESSLQRDVDRGVQANLP